jgi:hypothetical protein
VSAWIEAESAREEASSAQAEEVQQWLLRPSQVIREWDQPGVMLPRS